MKTIEVYVYTPNACWVGMLDGRVVAPSLTYTKEYYKKVPIPETKPVRYRQVRHEYPACLLKKHTDGFVFPRGLLKRVTDFCEKKNFPYNVHRLEDRVQYPLSPPIDKLIDAEEGQEITLRSDQKRLVQHCIDEQMGVIQSPTGSGKTIMQVALMRSAPYRKILLLVHLTSIVTQTKEKLEKYGLGPVQQVGAGEAFRGEFHKNIVVSTIQSFSHIDPDAYYKEFDMVIVDEAHHCNSFKSQYAQVLGNIYSTMKFGFTATVANEKKDPEKILAMEAMLGPVIGELSLDEAMDTGILATPKLKFLRCETYHALKEIRKYADVYETGVVNNVRRNRLIVETLLDQHPEQVSLIFVDRIEHGENLQRLFQERGVRVPFIQGSTPPLERENIKASLISRRRKVVIASTAWREGVDIPTLDVLVMAGAAKSEIPVMQSIGRGLRRTEGKEVVYIYDIFDPSHHYLISHFGERLCLYSELGWL
jgi:superfamily II DNA or RNA helicase